MYMGLASLVVLLAGLALSMAVIRKVVGSITLVAEKLGEMAVRGGNLTQRLDVESRDEIGLLAKAKNRLLESFRCIVAQIAEAVERLTSSNAVLKEKTDHTRRTTDEVRRATEHIAERTNEQTQKVQAIAQVANVISDASGQVASEALSARDMVRNAVELADKGEYATFQSLERMTQIRDKFESLGQVIQSLNHRSQEIENVVSVITDIADQTNLLALNAAIEAAQAGDKGRGFAIVAEEVRNLAKQAKASTIDIKRLMASVREDMANATRQMLQSKEAVNEGLKITEETERVFAAIAANVGLIAHSVERITAHIQEQRDTTQQVLQAVESIAGAARGLASMCQELSASADF